jgi:hypothetical protein
VGQSRVTGGDERSELALYGPTLRCYRPGPLLASNPGSILASAEGLVAIRRAGEPERSGSGWRSAPAVPMSCGWCCGKAWCSPSPGSASVCWRAWARAARWQPCFLAVPATTANRLHGVPASCGNRPSGHAARPHMCRLAAHPVSIPPKRCGTNNRFNRRSGGRGLART